MLVEDASELRPAHGHVVALEARPRQHRGRGRGHAAHAGAAGAADAARPAGGRRGPRGRGRRHARRDEHRPRGRVRDRCTPTPRPTCPSRVEGARPGRRPDPRGHPQPAARRRSTSWSTSAAVATGRRRVRELGVVREGDRGPSRSCPGSAFADDGRLVPGPGLDRADRAGRAVTRAPRLLAAAAGRGRRCRWWPRRAVAAAAGPGGGRPVPRARAAGGRWCRRLALARPCLVLAAALRQLVLVALLGPGRAGRRGWPRRRRPRRARPSSVRGRCSTSARRWPPTSRPGSRPCRRSSARRRSGPSWLRSRWPGGSTPTCPRRCARSRRLPGARRAARRRRGLAGRPRDRLRAGPGARPGGGGDPRRPSYGAPRRRRAGRGPGHRAHAGGAAASACCCSAPGSGATRSGSCSAPPRAWSAWPSGSALCFAGLLVARAHRRPGAAVMTVAAAVAAAVLVARGGAAALAARPAPGPPGPAAVAAPPTGASRRRCAGCGRRWPAWSALGAWALVGGTLRPGRRPGAGRRGRGSCSAGPRTPAVARRRERLAEELPTGVDLLAPCLDAGAAPEAALVTVGRALGGPVEEELLARAPPARAGGRPGARCGGPRPPTPSSARWAAPSPARTTAAPRWPRRCDQLAASCGSGPRPRSRRAPAASR